MKNSFSKGWLILFMLFSCIAFFFKEEILCHHLEKALHFGYDAFGRNCVFLSIYAGFESLSLIFILSVFCLFFSLLLSFLSSVKNEQIKYFWNTFLDTLSSLPGLLIALALSIFIRNQFFLLLFASFFFILPFLIRFYETQIKTLQVQEFIKASEALGASSSQTFYTHLLPSLLRSSLNLLPQLFARFIFIETSLSFLGVGRTETGETWGKLMLQGKDYLLEAPWIFILCGAPLFITILALQLDSQSKPEGQ